MSHIKVFARFRPLSSREISDHGDKVCIQRVDSETFNFKDEKEESLGFSFDKVFYDNSEQDDVYDCVALPIAQGAFYAINGTIIAYGQTGAGKTYSMEGPSILECEEKKKGLLPRVVDGIFECLKASQETAKYSIKLSMVEIYMERVRDLFDLEKDNIQIKENKGQGIFLQGATEEFANTCTIYWEHHNTYHETILFMMHKGALQTYELYDEVERFMLLFPDINLGPCTCAGKPSERDSLQSCWRD